MQKACLLGFHPRRVLKNIFQAPIFVENGLFLKGALKCRFQKKSGPLNEDFGLLGFHDTFDGMSTPGCKKKLLVSFTKRAIFPLNDGKKSSTLREVAAVGCYPTENQTLRAEKTRNLNLLSPFFQPRRGGDTNR